MSKTIRDAFELPCGLRLKNRLAKAAMSENMAKSHFPDQKFQILYEKFAREDLGLCISGNVMIDSSALGEPNNIILDEEYYNGEAYKTWVDAAQTGGTAFFVQLNHPGKQSPSFLSPLPVAPSAVPFKSPMNKAFNTPRALSENEIEQLIEKFVFAAQKVADAGAKGVQIHGAHGYLVSQFLSPRHNIRTDKWGGSLSNRARFLIRICEGVRQQCPKGFALAVKINSADFQKGGFAESDALELIQMLAGVGVDLVEISGGTYESPKMMGAGKKAKASNVRESTKVREAYFLDFCEKARQAASIPLMLTGGFRSSEGMNAALASEACDIIGLARSLAMDPSFSSKLLAGEPVTSPVKQLTTGIKGLDRVVPLEIVWYTAQLHRLGAGKQPNPDASVWGVFLSTVWEFGTAGLKRLRAK